MTLRSFFLKTKTHTVLTGRGWLTILAVVALLGLLSWPAIRWCVTIYTYHLDEVHPTSRIVLENWDGSIDLFDGGKHVALALGAQDIYSIIFEDAYNDVRKRHAYILNAWAVGIDTTHFYLIPVPKTEPKTLHIGQRVLAYANQQHWQELTVVTFDLHSARSRKAYLLAAKPYGISIIFTGIPLDGVDHTNWAKNGSGLTMAFSELLKKIYYDVCVF
jgi:hypothetical protein